MRRIAYLVAMVVLLLNAQAQNGVRNEAVIWYQFSETVNLSDKWDATFVVQYRDFVQRDKDYHLFLSSALSRKLGNGFGIGAGFTNLNINRVVGANYMLVPELRPFQQITFGSKLEKLQFNWRFMIEERYFRKATNGELISGYDFNFRIRNLTKITIPLSQSFDLALSTEVLINGGGNANLNVFDQNRSMVLGGYKTGKLKLSTGYMHWAALTGGDVLENRHTWMIMASHSL